MSINDETNSSNKLDDGDDEEEEKRLLIQDSNNNNAATAIGDTGDAVDLEEGEIDDEEEEEAEEDNKAKKSHKRKRKHKNRKKRKTAAVVYGADVYAYENDINKQSPDKKLKTEDHDDRPQSLLSLPLLMNEDNLNDGDYRTQNGERRTNEQQQQTVKSLFDLFSNSIGGGSGFFDPTITEKENSKPAKQQQEKKATNEAQKMTKKERRELGILSKKEIKKRKYLESLKEKQKRELEWKEKSGEMICKFYLEGRCTKGDECQFSHKAPLPKKTEVCKYYLNGYCAKNTNCTFMHAEFPCKFYHMNNLECKSGDSCRFSHEPLSAETREILNKFINETSDSQQPLLLGSIPSLMGISVKQQQQPPSLMTFESIKPALFSQDIDERCGDIDERSTIQQQENLFENPLVKLLKPTQDLVTSLLPALLTAAASSSSVSVIQSSDSIINSLFKNFQTEPIEIDARTDGSLPYRAIPIHVPQSSLWTKLPSSVDCECDPRIEFYSNKVNNKRSVNSEDSIQIPSMVSVNTQMYKTIANDSSALSPPTHQYQYSSQNEVKHQQQQHQQTSKPSQTREYRDPRLSSKSLSNSNQNELYQQQHHNNRNDNLIEINKKTKPESNSNRLTIADYKRKVQKEVIPTNDYLARENSYSNHHQQHSYSIGISEFKAPQSLHELLKNYPS